MTEHFSPGRKQSGDARLRVRPQGTAESPRFASEPLIWFSSRQRCEPREPEVRCPAVCLRSVLSSGTQQGMLPAPC